eukprot:COSAG06_NODE_254_length_19039_cov_5.465488_5_plen_94_part_00
MFLSLSWQITVCPEPVLADHSLSRACLGTCSFPTIIGQLLNRKGRVFSRVFCAGSYVCNLADPYERVVGNELVELAWREVGENWENEMLDGQP